MGSDFNEHAETSPLLDQLLVHQVLIALQDSQRVDAILGRNIPHRGQRITFLEYAIEHHRNHAIAKLAINRLTVIPLMIHSLLQIFPVLCTARWRRQETIERVASIEHRTSAFSPPLVDVESVTWC